MKKFTLAISFMLITFFGKAEFKEIPFTLDDRDRIIRLEQKVEALNEKIEALNEKNELQFKALNDRIDAQNEKFDAQNEKFDAQNEKFSTLFTLIYIILGSIITLMGFVLWDRRSTLKPIERQAKEIEAEHYKIIRVLKDMAKNDLTLAELLKANRIL
ncbi:MAG: hypothetical protein HY738_14365 [Bacteroidia bacterium]|nr:hypothetical protein [Bacteroidia bacterium]